MILVAGLCFRARQRFAADTVDGFQCQKILRANLRNRTVEHGGAACALAEFPCNFRRELRIWLLVHQLQSLLDLLVRNNAEEGRLCQLYGESLAQRPSKTVSPVVLAKSARTMVSLSVSA